MSPSISGATIPFDIDADTDVLDCTYFNELQVGALKILKNSTKGGPVSQPGAVFSYDGESVTDNGAGDEDPEVGEVCVSGVCVARGYVDRPELEAVKFVPNPHPEGGRLYRTGDLGRRLPTGDLQYLGRLDSLVKIRGMPESGRALSLPGQKLTIPAAGASSLEGYWLVIEMVSRPIQGQTYSVTSHSQRSLFGAIGSM